MNLIVILNEFFANEGINRVQYAKADILTTCILNTAIMNISHNKEITTQDFTRWDLN